jgi:hypothetical protein
MLRRGKVRWAGLVSHRGEMRNQYKIWVRKPEERRTEEDVGTDGRIIFTWVLEKDCWTL